MTLSLVKQNLIIAAVAVIGVAIIFTVHIATAAPTQAPPLGNPAYGEGPKGPTGNRGSTGSKGSTGPAGYAGAKGSAGATGMGPCNWSGGTWVSHGWDGGCAWSTGAYFYCSGSRLVNIVAYEGCGWGL